MGRPADAAHGPGPAALAAWRGVEWTRRSLTRFVDARGSRQSAAIAYYVLLSLFPLMLLLASVAGLVLSDGGLRADFVGALTDVLPLTEAGADDLEEALRGVSSSAGTVGLISLVALAWTASGMMGAIRGSLDDIDPDTPARPFARGKLVDLLMLVVAILLLVSSAGLTVATRVGGSATRDLVGLPGLLFAVAGVVVPIALGTGLLVVLLRWVPTRGPAVRDLWPACLVGSVALWALTTGFAAFIGHFGRYNVIYGSLAAVVVFLVFVYLAANLMLLTAAFGAEWRGVRRDRPGAEPGPGLGEEVRRFLRGLFVRDDGPRRRSLLVEGRDAQGHQRRAHGEAGLGATERLVGRPPDPGHGGAVAGPRAGRERAPCPGAGIEGLHGGDGPAGALAADHHHLPTGRGRPVPPARRGGVGEAGPPARDGVIDLRGRHVGVQAAGPPADGVDLPHQRGDAQVLAWRVEAAEGAPPQGAQVEVERGGGQGRRPAAADAPDHVELVAHDRSPSRRARLGQARQRAPAAVEEHPGRVGRAPSPLVRAVATDDVEAPAARDGHRVVARLGQVREADPAPPPRVVEIDPR